MATKSIAVPDAIYERAQAAAAAEGTTVETFAAKALDGPSQQEGTDVV